MRRMTADCIDWIKEYFRSTDNSNAVIGISGGKDSAVVAALCTEAIGKDRVIGVLMPNGFQADIEDSRQLCDFLRVKKMLVDISSICTGMSQCVFNASHDIKELSEQTRINMIPRIRMTTLYAIAQSINGRVANTSNLDESLVGYCTLWGDNVGDFSPLGNLHVSDVLEIGDDLGLPYSLVHKTPSDGLTGISDEDKIGFSYADVECAYEKFYNEELTDNEKKAASRIEQFCWKRNMLNIPAFVPHLFLK